MENRKLRKEPVRDEAPVKLKGRDFEPLLTTPPPKQDDPPNSYDCKVPHSGPAPRRGGKRG
jgi:hypothetical protein